MSSTANIERAKPFRRVLRLFFGILVYVLIVPYYFVAPANMLFQTILVTIGLAVFYVVLDMVINKFILSLTRSSGQFLQMHPSD